MSRPSIVENNELLNADDYDLRYRNTEAKLRLERPDLWAYVLQVRGPDGEPRRRRGQLDIRGAEQCFAILRVALHGQRRPGA